VRILYWCLFLGLAGALPKSLGSEPGLFKVTWEQVRADGLVATYLRPKGDIMRPALIILGGSEGGKPESLAYKFAERGWAPLAVAYFGVNGLPDNLANIPIEYGSKAVAWLGKQPLTDVSGLGVVGISRGTELALLLATHNPAIKRVVAYSPSHVVWGPVGASHDPLVSAWTLGGRPWPHVPPVRPPDYSAQPYYGTPDFLADLHQTALVEAAAIPVEKIHGAVLLLSGEDDQIWPATLMARLLVKRLEAAHHPYRFRHVSFPGAGHLLTPNADPGLVEGRHPTGVQIAFGGSKRANREAQEKAWHEVMEFLQSDINALVTQ
jgi:dienelactone hydrolase